MSTRCFAADCGRVHDIDDLTGAFEGRTFCAYHRAELELGTPVTCRDGDTAWYDAEDGLILLPPAWTPRSRGTAPAEGERR